MFLHFKTSHVKQLATNGNKQTRVFKDRQAVNEANQSKENQAKVNQAKENQAKVNQAKENQAKEKQAK